MLIFYEYIGNTDFTIYKIDKRHLPRCIYIDDDIMIEKKRIIKRKLLKLFNHNYQIL